MTATSRDAAGVVAGAVVIVTGGADGIGLAISEHLAQSGYQVVIADIRGSQAAAERLANEGLHVMGHDTDVSSESAVAALMEAVLARHGRVDVLVNNAGIFTSLTPKPFEALDVGEWQQVFNVNVLGVFLASRAVVAPMRRQGGGRIINISSGVAFKGNPGMAHYVASKGAVVSLTRAMATELGEAGILVNSVAPGFTLSSALQDNAALMAGAREPSVRTRVLARDMHPDDLLGAVAFFAGNGAAFITGQTLVVDGGAYYH